MFSPHRHPCYGLQWHLCEEKQPSYRLQGLKGCCDLMNGLPVKQELLSKTISQVLDLFSFSLLNL